MECCVPQHLQMYSTLIHPWHEMWMVPIPLEFSDLRRDLGVVITFRHFLVKGCRLIMF